jgi:hypothetical protein
VQDARTGWGMKAKSADGSQLVDVRPNEALAIVSRFIASWPLQRHSTPLTLMHVTLSQGSYVIQRGNTLWWHLWHVPSQFLSSPDANSTLVQLWWQCSLCAETCQSEIYFCETMHAQILACLDVHPSISTCLWEFYVMTQFLQLSFRILKHVLSSMLICCCACVSQKPPARPREILTDNISSQCVSWKHGKLTHEGKPRLENSHASVGYCPMYSLIKTRCIL